jgi:hypothetical protein
MKMERNEMFMFTSPLHKRLENCWFKTCSKETYYKNEGLCKI